MKDKNWAKQTIKKLQKHLSRSDLLSTGGLQEARMTAVHFVVDELRDASLEDIAALVVRLVVHRPEPDTDEVEALQDEVEELKSQLRVLKGGVTALLESF